jgi:hypothetical protein
MSHPLKGRKQSPEHIEKRMAPQRGRPRPATAGDNNPMRRPENREKFKGDNNPMRRPEVAAKLTGENHGRWVGDDIGYGGMHERLRAALRGKPCAHADGSCAGPVHSALIRGCATRRSPEGLRYSTRIEDYMPLCESHHVRYDGTGFTSERGRQARLVRIAAS